MKYYATQWAPNGTNDLVITDDNGTVVGSIPEALFGVNVLTPSTGFDVCYYGESIGYMQLPDTEEEFDTFNRIRDGEVEDLSPVAELSEESVYTFLARSPVDPDSGSIIAQLNDIVFNNS